jgi:hypothetical protein
VLTLDEMKAQYSDVSANTWNQFVDKDGEVIKSGGDITDYAYVRKEVLIQVRKSIRETTKASTPIQGNPNNPVQLPVSSDKLFEVVERWVDDHFTVFLPMEGTPIEIKDNDNPYDHQTKPFSRTGFFPRPFSFYWLGIPKLVDHLQELLNSVTTPTDPVRDDAHDKAVAELRATVTAQGTTLTTLETRWQLVAALAVLVGGGAVTGAIATRDAVQATALRVAALERAQNDAAAVARERDADDRRTTEALVRLTVTVDALRARVEDLTSELRARETAPMRPVGR